MQKGHIYIYIPFTCSNGKISYDKKSNKYKVAQWSWTGHSTGHDYYLGIFEDADYESDVFTSKFCENLHSKKR